LKTARSGKGISRREPGAGATGTADSGLIILTALGTVPDILREHGVDPGEVFALAGLDPQGLAEPARAIPYAVMGRLLSRCVALSGCPHFGLLAGARLELSALGAVGFLVQHSPDVGTGLRNLIAYMHQDQRGGVPTLSTDGEEARLGYLIYQPGVESVEQISDGALANCANILRALCGPEFSPREVAFERAPPADASAYRRIFGAPLRFAAGENSIAFSADWLTRPVPNADAMLYRVVLRQVEGRQPGGAAGFPAALRGVVRTLLITGRCSADEAARLFGFHRRTLHRRLKADGLTFEALVEAVRFDLAQELLGGTRSPFSQIAATLGYADSTAFSRAFRRWSGTTPGRWREQAQGHGLGHRLPAAPFAGVLKD